MSGMVERITEISVLRECAEMMTSTPLWGETGYDFDRCLLYLTHSGMQVTGVLREDRVVGFAAVLEHGMVFEPMLVALCVEEGARGTGVGSLLMEVLESENVRMYLTVTETNTARLFYEHRGWGYVGALPDHEEPGVAELIMRWVRPLLS